MSLFVRNDSDFRCISLTSLPNLKVLYSVNGVRNDNTGVPGWIAETSVYLRMKVTENSNLFISLFLRTPKCDGRQAKAVEVAGRPDVRIPEAGAAAGLIGVRWNSERSSEWSSERRRLSSAS